jgi:N-acetylglucosamine-6-phosphate deacetylase
MSAAPADVRLLSAFPSGNYTSPGWVDLQVNGFAGQDFNAAEPQPESVGLVGRSLAAEGVRHFCPTVITQSPDHMLRAVQTLTQGCLQDAAAGAMVLGFHLEGPWISPLDGARGAHPQQWIREPKWDEFHRLQDAAEGRIRVVTLAPEVPGALEIIEKLTSAGVLVSLGHHLATSAQIKDAISAGARLCTHLGNGVPAILPRHPNVIWDQLAEDQLVASAIYDGHHLPESVMHVLPRAKGLDRLILVSDAASPARCAPGIYEASIGGKVELSAAGRLSLLGTPYLAGAALGLKEGLENAVRFGHVSLANACAMVSTNVWKLLGSSEPDTSTVFHWDATTLQISFPHDHS